MAGKTVTTEQFEQAYQDSRSSRARGRRSRPLSRKARQVVSLSVGECLAFPCRPEAHAVTQSGNQYCRFASQVWSAAKSHGQRVQVAHSEGKLFVRRVE